MLLATCMMVHLEVLVVGGLRPHGDAVLGPSGAHRGPAQVPLVLQALADHRQHLLTKIRGWRGEIVVHVRIVADKVRV